MIDVAMVGYQEFPFTARKMDLVTWLPQTLEGERELHFCHVGVVDEPGADFLRMLDDVVKSEADVLHYANFRDPYHKRKPFDRPFLTCVHAMRPGLPILITSAHPDAETFAGDHGMDYLYTPFDLDDYAGTLAELAERDRG